MIWNRARPVWMAIGLLLPGVAVSAQTRALTENPLVSRQINILEHLGNSHHLDLPYWKPPYTYPLELPRFAPLQVGGVTLDFSITRHLVFMILAALIVVLVFSYTSRAVARAQAAGPPPPRVGGGVGGQGAPG